MTIFWICVAIGVVVFGVMFWSIFGHRKSKGAKPANFHEHPLVEVLWTLIPLVILVIMAIPATATLVDMYPALFIRTPNERFTSRGDRDRPAFMSYGR